MGQATPEPADEYLPTPSGSTGSNLDDEDYPAYSMAAAAAALGVTAAFLSALDTAKLLTPHRSASGHRRYSRYQLRLTARVRELLDQGTALDAACRIVFLEDQLAEARAINTALQQQHSDTDGRTASG